MIVRLGALEKDIDISAVTRGSLHVSAAVPEDSKDIIHLHHLKKAYDSLFNGSRRYVLIAEHYNPYPVTAVYRGHKDRFFKRDFAGELMD